MEELSALGFGEVLAIVGVVVSLVGLAASLIAIPEDRRPWGPQKPSSRRGDRRPETSARKWDGATPRTFTVRVLDCYRHNPKHLPEDLTFYALAERDALIEVFRGHNTAELLPLLRSTERASLSRDQAEEAVLQAVERLARRPYRLKYWAFLRLGKYARAEAAKRLAQPPYAVSPPQPWER